MLGRQEKPQQSDNVNLFASSHGFDKGNVEQSVLKQDARIDGGLVAWLQVLGAFCLFFSSW